MVFGDKEVGNPWFLVYCSLWSRDAELSVIIVPEVPSVARTLDRKVRGKNRWFLILTEYDYNFTWNNKYDISTVKMRRLRKSYQVQPPKYTASIFLSAVSSGFQRFRYTHGWTGRARWSLRSLCTLRTR